MRVSVVLGAVSVFCLSSAIGAGSARAQGQATSERRAGDAENPRLQINREVIGHALSMAIESSGLWMTAQTGAYGRAYGPAPGAGIARCHGGRRRVVPRRRVDQRQRELSRYANSRRRQLGGRRRLDNRRRHGGRHPDRGRGDLGGRRRFHNWRLRLHWEHPGHGRRPQRSGRHGHKRRLRNWKPGRERAIDRSGRQGGVHVRKPYSASSSAQRPHRQYTAGARRFRGRGGGWITRDDWLCPGAASSSKRGGASTIAIDCSMKR